MDALERLARIGQRLSEGNAEAMRIIQEKGVTKIEAAQAVLKKAYAENSELCAKCMAAEGDEYDCLSAELSIVDEYCEALVGAISDLEREADEDGGL